jgi:putative Holliday junction resolvase
MTSRAERFARQLEGRFGLEVARVDERYTTEEAETALAQAGVRAEERDAVRDQVAAQLILDAWFDDTKETGSPGVA